MNPFIAEVIAALRHEGQLETARGVEACAQYARLWVPAQGLFMPTPEGSGIEHIAERHFGATAAKRALREALSIVTDARQRDAIESAVNELCCAYDETHYYLGLASAFTIVAFGRSGVQRRGTKGREHRPHHLLAAARPKRRE